jgi:hypothetical protein
MGGSGFIGGVIPWVIGYTFNHSLVSFAPYTSLLILGGFHALHISFIHASYVHFCRGGL